MYGILKFFLNNFFIPLSLFSLIVYFTYYSVRNLLTIFIASVWLVNGLVCKILNLVPRHQLIVGRILGEEYAILLTKIIGVAEVMLAIIIISGFRARQVAILQVILIATMNLIEIFMVPDLLLFGKFNGLVALAFILLILFANFGLPSKNHQSKTYELHS